MPMNRARYKSLLQSFAEGGEANYREPEGLSNEELKYMFGGKEPARPVDTYQGTYLPGTTGLPSQEPLMLEQLDPEAASAARLLQELNIKDKPKKLDPKRATPVETTPLPLKGEQAAPKTRLQGIKDAYIASMTQAESGGKADAENMLSSATGLHQFTDDTWLDLVQRHKPDWAKGLSTEEVLAKRTDPKASTEMAKIFTDENASYLKDMGIKDTPENLYIAHFLGKGNAGKVLSQPDDASIHDILPISVRWPNYNVFGVFGEVDTVGEFKDWAERKMSQGPRTTGQEKTESRKALEAITPKKEVDSSAWPESLKPLVEGDRSGGRSPTGMPIIDNLLDAVTPGRIGVKTDEDFPEEMVKVTSNVAGDYLQGKLKDAKGNTIQPVITPDGGLNIDYNLYKTWNLVGGKGSAESREQQVQREGGFTYDKPTSELTNPVARGAQGLDIAYRLATSKDPATQATFANGSGTAYVNDGQVIYYDQYGYDPISSENVKDAYGAIRKVLGFVDTQVDDFLKKQFGVELLENYPVLMRLGSVEEVFGPNGDDLVKMYGIKPLPQAKMQRILKSRQEARDYYGNR